MRTFLLYVPAIACVAMMAGICIPTMRNMRRDDHHQPGAPDLCSEVAALREEVARLQAERRVGVQSGTDGAVDG